MQNVDIRYQLTLKMYVPVIVRDFQTQESGVGWCRYTLLGAGYGLFGMETFSTDDIFEGSELLLFDTIPFTFKYSRAYVVWFRRILCDVPKSVSVLH